MKVFIFMIIAVCLFTTCVNKIDFSNPKSVTENYYSYLYKGELESGYKLIADTCKEFVTLQDYLEYFSYYDSVFKEFKFEVQKIEQLPIDPTKLKYRRYEIKTLIINKIDKDTLISLTYRTLYNEKDKWKIIWTGNISSAAEKLDNSQRFHEAIHAYKEVLKYDPLSGLQTNRLVSI